jgi:Peptidase family M28
VAAASTSDPGRVTGPAALLLLILVCAIVARGERPPAALGIGAPATDFSAARAMRDVDAIAKAPHPLTSPEHDRVRNYLLSRLKELGLNPEARTTASRAHKIGEPDAFAIVTNIVARISGTKSTGSVMLVAHYDSVPSSPGASDDSASVAAILEAMHALRAGPQLRNDVIVLLTDGEELGMLGSAAAANDASLMKDVRVILNFEMRGDRGPSVMFESSRSNSWLIEALANAPYPHGTSTSEAIHQRLCRDTDLAIFIERGSAGMNLAASGGILRYHTALDDVQNLSADTLQHQGSYALAMARYFGAMRFGANRGGANDVYFVIGGHLFHYSERLALPLAILVALIVAGVIVNGIRERRFSLGGVAAGAIVYFASFVVAIVDVALVLLAMRHATGWEMLPQGTTYGGDFLGVASIALVVASLWGGYAWMSRRAPLQNLGAGALLASMILMIASAALLPGASFLLTWPLLFAAVALGAGSGASNGHPTVRPALLAILALLPATVLFTPTIVGADGTTVVAVLAALSFWLMFGLAIPYLDVLTNGVRWLIPFATMLVAVVSFIVGVEASGFDAAHPRPDTICYMLDSDAGRAMWTSVDSRPDRFTAQFFHDHVRGAKLAQLTGLAEPDDDTATDLAIAGTRSFSGIGDGRAIVGDAPTVALSPPEIVVRSDKTTAAGRTLSLHVRSTRGAPIIWLAVPAGINVLSTRVDNTLMTSVSLNGWSGWYWNAPAGGFDVELELGSRQAFALTAIDQTWGMPTPPGFFWRPRSAEQMAAPFFDFDSATLVRRTKQFAHAGF